MNLNNNSFSLRDYLAYLFPGILLFWAYFLLEPEAWILLKKDSVLSTLVFLVGGYFLGYMSNVLSTRTIIKILDDIFGDPTNTTISNPNGNGFNSNFAKILSEKLKNYWGQEIFEAGESNLFFLCWRDLQKSDHKGIDYQFRLVSLWNFCTSTLVPSAILAFVFLIQSKYFLAVFFVVVFVLAAISRISMRREFSRNVYRIWYVINKDA